MNMVRMMDSVHYTLRAHIATELQAGRLEMLLSPEAIQLSALVEETAAGFEIVLSLTLPDGYRFEVREPITPAEIARIQRHGIPRPWREPEEEVSTWLQSFSVSPDSPPSMH